MATTGVGFRWLDLLEKEFDKACVELDTSLSKYYLECAVFILSWQTLSHNVFVLARQKVSLFLHKINVYNLVMDW